MWVVFSVSPLPHAEFLQHNYHSAPVIQGSKVLLSFFLHLISSCLQVIGFVDGASIVKALLKELHGATKLNGDGSNWQQAFRAEELEATVKKFFQVRLFWQHVMFTYPIHYCGTGASHLCRNQDCDGSPDIHRADET